MFGAFSTMNSAVKEDVMDDNEGSDENRLDSDLKLLQTVSHQIRQNMKNLRKNHYNRKAKMVLNLFKT